jgi:hypothetical protein
MTALQTGNIDELDPLGASELVDAASILRSSAGTRAARCVEHIDLVMLARIVVLACLRTQALRRWRPYRARATRR